MRAHVARSGVLLLFVAAMVSVTASSALAKGPESVTVTGPGMDRPIELMDTANPDLIGLLMEQTGLWYATGDLPLPLQEPPGELGSSYALTWIRYGSPGERVDERTIRQVIYPDAKTGPVIHTPAQEGLRGWGPGVTGWFAAPSGLPNTLAKLGVPVEAASLSTETPPSDVPADAVDAGAPPEHDSANSYLAVVGFALVVLAGALGVRRMLGWRRH